jgi:hypothetical protein
VSTRIYGSGSCDNVFPARPTAGMHAAVKVETDAQLHARLTEAHEARGYRVRVTSENSVEFLAELRVFSESSLSDVVLSRATATTYGGALRALEIVKAW